MDVEDQVDLRMGTFSKSLASCGGFIAGPADVIDFLRVQSRSFMFTAAAVPAAIGAALGALEIIRSDEGPQLMARVLDNARYLHDGLADLGYQVMEPNRLPDGSEVITPIVPVLVGDDWKAVFLWKALYDAGVYVNVAIYPAVQRGGALLRTSVMATHETRAPRPRPRRLRDASRARSRTPAAHVAARAHSQQVAQRPADHQRTACAAGRLDALEAEALNCSPSRTLSSWHRRALGEPGADGCA